jgi:hypothetical protein
VRYVAARFGVEVPQEFVMRYADKHCEIKGVGDKYIITGQDVFTGKPVTVEVPSFDLFKYRQGILIQHAMPTLTVQEREFLISGMYEDQFEGIDD